MREKSGKTIGDIIRRNAYSHKPPPLVVACDLMMRWGNERS